MTPDLGEFLRDVAARRRKPGEWDCCTFPATWALACGWPDPMVAWRGAYDCEETAHAFIAGAGGLEFLFAKGMAAAGVPEVVGSDFEPGDIGVMQMIGEQAGAVYTGRRWAFVVARGMGFTPVEPEHIVKAWLVAHG